jgi:hypothetical protein
MIVVYNKLNFDVVAAFSAGVTQNILGTFPTLYPPLQLFRRNRDYRFSHQSFRRNRLLY